MISTRFEVIHAKTLFLDPPIPHHISSQKSRPPPPVIYGRPRLILRLPSPSRYRNA